MVGSQLVDVAFARADEARLPTTWDEQLVGFRPHLPLRREDLVSLLGDPFAVRNRDLLYPPPFAMVADFDGDAGAHRLVVPELTAVPWEHGFTYKLMLSPDAQAALRPARR